MQKRKQNSKMKRSRPTCTGSIKEARFYGSTKKEKNNVGRRRRNEWTKSGSSGPSKSGGSEEPTVPPKKKIMLVEDSDDEDEEMSGSSGPSVPPSIPLSVAEPDDEGNEDTEPPVVVRRSEIVPTLVPYQYEGSNEWYLGIVQAGSLMYIDWSTGATSVEESSTLKKFTMQQFVNVIKPKMKQRKIKSTIERRTCTIN